MARLKAMLAVISVAVATAAVVDLSSSDADANAVTAVNEEIVVDGITVYRTERDNGPAIYKLDPLSDTQVADLETAPAFGSASYDHLTTGDVDGCTLLAQRPERLVDGCVLALAMQQEGDLDAKPGPAQLVYSVCGREPGPGEIEDCGDRAVGEDEIAAAQARMRDALATAGI